MNFVVKKFSQISANYVKFMYFATNSLATSHLIGSILQISSKYQVLQ